MSDRVKSPPAGMPRIVPMVSYEDVVAAASWLEDAFGFRERLRYAEPDGTLSHLQLEFGDDGLIMLGSAGGNYVSPRRHARTCDVMRQVYDTDLVSDGLHVYVDDVEAHYERARQGGATILSGLENTPFGDRHYRVEDPEGHRWMFAQHVRDLEAGEWGAEPSSSDPRDP